MSDPKAKVDASGNLEFEGLDTNQLLAILSAKITDMDKRLSGIEARIDAKLDDVATKSDLQRFGERMSKLERQLNDHDDWIQQQKAKQQDAEQSFGQRLKNKGVDYVIAAVILVIAFLFVWGIVRIFGVVDGEHTDVNLDRLQ